MSKDRDATMLMPTLSDPRKKKADDVPVQGESHLRTHVTYPKVHIVVVGNMVEGYTFDGPLHCAETAMKWAVGNLKIGEGVQIYPMSHVRGVRGEVETTV